MLIALPSPMVLPPPIDIMLSALRSFASWVASSVISVGVCITALENTPAASEPKRSLMVIALST